MIESRWRRPLRVSFGSAAVVATTTLFVSAGPALAAGGGGGGDPWVELGWKTFNLVVLVGLIWFFGRKPIGNLFRNAAQQARDLLEVRRAEASAAEAELAEQRRRIEGLEAELQRMLGEAREEARQEQERLVSEARTQAERIKSTVRMQVEQEFNKARKELQADLANETVRLAEDMIRGRMDDEGRRRVVTRAIDQLGAGS